MIALLGSSAANMTADEALTAYLINSICLTAATSCTGGNAQFSSVQSCMSGLGSKAVGTFDRLKGMWLNHLRPMTLLYQYFQRCTCRSSLW